MPTIQLLGRTEHYDTPQTFNYAKVAKEIASTGTCVSRGEHGAVYWNSFQTYDIESTSFCSNEERKFGVMYIWMTCVHRYVVMGRTWDEFLMFEECLREALRQQNPVPLLVTYVHYLPFEFQFTRNFVNFTEIFATEKRKVLRALGDDFFEYRCSYRLTNMSLEKFLDSLPNIHYKKQSGEDFDYSIVRTPLTVLSNEELGYCFCDVRGLYEGIEFLLQSDTLASIPMTSTGYLRREVRAEMRKNPRNHYLIRNTMLSADQYDLCQMALRGGNAHANPSWAGEVL